MADEVIEMLKRFDNIIAECEKTRYSLNNYTAGELNIEEAKASRERLDQMQDTLLAECGKLEDYLNDNYIGVGQLTKEQEKEKREIERRCDAFEKEFDKLEKEIEKLEELIGPDYYLEPREHISDSMSSEIALNGFFHTWVVVFFGVILSFAFTYIVFEVSNYVLHELFNLFDVDASTAIQEGVSSVIAIIHGVVSFIFLFKKAKENFNKENSKNNM